MYDLTDFRLTDMVECSAALRKLGGGASSLSEVAEQAVRFLYDRLVDRDSRAPACALVRCFKTHPYGDLTPELRRVADTTLGKERPTPQTPCLTLLASAGDDPNWNSPNASADHRVIPLISEQMVERLPMISQLIRQLGLDVTTVLRPDPSVLVDLEHRTFNVFHVEDAASSPHVPAKEFVRAAHVKSAFGFGGMLPNGALFAMILFSKVFVPRETAEMFKTLPLSVKVSFLHFADRPLFRIPR